MTYNTDEMLDHIVALQAEVARLQQEVGRLNAEASVMEAWLAGVASKPPETGRKKVSVQAIGDSDK